MTLTWVDGQRTAGHSWTQASSAGIVTTFKTRTVRRGTARTWQQNFRELLGISKNYNNTWADRYNTPSRSAPSSTSPMSPVPADDSSSNRESVLRSKAMFSMPFVGVLKQEKELCSFVFISATRWVPKRPLFHAPSITCRACIQWVPYPAQGWTQWCPAHLRYPRSQATLKDTQHRNPDNTDRESTQASFKHQPE